MNIQLIFILSFGGGVISCCSAWLCQVWLIKRLKSAGSMDGLKPLLRFENLNLHLESQWSTLNLDREIQEIVDHHLNDLFEVFKARIPMLAMFLSHEREEQLKEQARAELMKLVPSIKQRVLGKIAAEKSLHDALIAGVISRIEENMQPLAQMIWNPLKRQVFTRLFLAGFCLGLLEALLLAFI